MNKLFSIFADLFHRPAFFESVRGFADHQPQSQRNRAAVNDFDPEIVFSGLLGLFQISGIDFVFGCTGILDGFAHSSG